MNPVIATVVVTYNRKALLERCLLAIASQTRSPDRVLIVDNASTDGTREWLAGWLPDHLPSGELLALTENGGGAGGFAKGMQWAIDAGADWVWMMDDDAEPHLDALGHLLSGKLDIKNIYASLALDGGSLSWPLVSNGSDRGRTYRAASELPEEMEIRYTPFLGILVSTTMIRDIGVADAGFFIASEDTDYCYRAHKHGARIILRSRSRIEHPRSQSYCLRLPGRQLHTLRLAPWKRYYDVRNRIFVTRNHFGMAVYYSAIPGALLRLLSTLWHEPHRFKQSWAYVAGMVDGVLGRKGCRHERWGIRP